MDTNFRAKNHTVPGFYLRNFSRDGDSVREYRTLVHHKSEPLWRNTSIKVLTRYEHFYTENSNGSLSDALERQFDAEFEVPGRDAILRAIKGEQLTRGHWSALVRFLALQDSRTPVSLARFLENAPKMFDHAFNGIQEDFKKAFPDGLPQEAIDGFMNFFRELGIAGQFQEVQTNTQAVRYEMRGNINRKTWLQYVKHGLAGEPLQHLIAHRWTILRPAPSMTFLTSDNPVVILRRKPEGGWTLTNGWNRPNSRIFMALDPQHLLFTAVGEKRRERGTALNAKEVDFINSAIAKAAYRSIISLNDNAHIGSYRERKVDRSMCLAEEALWAEWHSLHLRAEAAGPTKW